MKRIIGAILIVALICNLTSISFAASDAAAYYSVPVEYSDHPGQIEKLRFMVQGENAYVNARALAERLGYSYNESGAVVTVYNLDPDSALPCSATVFQSGSTQVSHMVYCKFNEQYQAPFATVQNDQGTWIPFFYALRMFNSGAVQTEETLLIDIPTKNILDLYFQIALHATTYLFDWADDFGYSGFDQQVLGICGHVTNVCNGLLEFDGASWATMFQQFTGHKAAYDEKYGEELAMLLCTEADKELQETAEQIERYLDLLNEDGTLGRLLSQTSMLLDKDITTLYQQCETILKNIQAGNSPLLSYNRSYQALELALDRQTWFSKTGGTILEMQSDLTSTVGNAFTWLDIGLKMGEVAGYAMEFQKHDDFALSALTYYLDHVAEEVTLPSAMQESLSDYAEILSADLGSYMVKRFEENVGKWIIDALPGEKLLGLQGEALRFSWDLASNTIPFLSNGLSAADSYELALYGQLLQFNAYHSFLSKRDQVLGADEITPEAIYETAQLCYVFLKSCYLTREAALASLVNKPQSVKEQIQPLVDYQNDINQEIAQVLVQLKKADKTNNRGVYGFLPADNQAFLESCDDSVLIAWLNANTISSAPTSLTPDELAARLEESMDFAWNWFYINSHVDSADCFYDPEIFGGQIPYERIMEPGVNTQQDVLELTETYFTEAVAEELLQLKYWIERDGALYVSGTEGVGGLGGEVLEIQVTQDSSTQYTITAWELFQGEPVPWQTEPMVFHCIYENGNWVFDRYIHNISVKAVDTFSHEESSAPSVNLLQGLPVTMIYDAGEGAWSTELTLHRDGTFSGSYRDYNVSSADPALEEYFNAELPNGIYSKCDFIGRFGNIRKISDVEYAMDLEELTYLQAPHVLEVVDGALVDSAEAYGLSRAEEVRLYLPGWTTADFSLGVQERLKRLSGVPDLPVVLDRWCLYNCEEGTTFLGSTADDLAETTTDYSVTFRRILSSTDHAEYAEITAYGSNGQQQWHYTTPSYPLADLTRLEEIGQFGSLYLYNESGTIVALDVYTGEVLWKNTEFGGASIAAVSDEKAVYLCGYYGPCLFAVSYAGDTIKRIETINDTYKWPSWISFSSEGILIYMDDGPKGFLEKGYLFKLDHENFQVIEEP